MPWLAITTIGETTTRRAVAELSEVTIPELEEADRIDARMTVRRVTYDYLIGRPGVACPSPLGWGMVPDPPRRRMILRAYNEAQVSYEERTANAGSE